MPWNVEDFIHQGNIFSLADRVEKALKKKTYFFIAHKKAARYIMYHFLWSAWASRKRFLLLKPATMHKTLDSDQNSAFLAFISEE